MEVVDRDGVDTIDIERVSLSEGLDVLGDAGASSVMPSRGRVPKSPAMG